MDSHATEYDKTFGPKIAAKPEPKLETSVSFADVPESTMSKPEVAAAPKQTIIQKVQSAMGLTAPTTAEAAPVKREPKGPMGPAPDGTAAEIGALRQEMKTGFDSANKSPTPAPKQMPPDQSDAQHQNMMSTLPTLNKSPINPTQKRLSEGMNSWTGDHYDLGNKY